MLQPDKKTNVTWRCDTQASATNLAALQKSLSRNRIWRGPLWGDASHYHIFHRPTPTFCCCSFSSVCHMSQTDLRESNAMTVLLRIGCMSVFRLLLTGWMYYSLASSQPISFVPLSMSRTWALTCSKWPQLIGPSISCWWCFHDISCSS